MDIEKYFSMIKFKPVGKEGQFYILEARISSGDEMIVRVLSLNNASTLNRMKWKKLWGLDTNKALDIHKLQTFMPPLELTHDKCLQIQERTATHVIYMHNDYPYIVTMPNQDVYDQYSKEDSVTLSEALGFPSYEVKRFG